VPGLGFATTPLARSSPLSPLHLVHQDQQATHEKCGFIIYRCAYKDDKAWNRFKQTLQAQTLRTIAFHKDTAEAIDSLEWNFVDDRISLEGASKD
jgi:hypothetical protein